MSVVGKSRRSQAALEVAGSDPYRTTLQKSGLSARGTSASFPGYQLRFSAHTISGQSRGSPSLRYVIVAVHGVVNMFLSSIVNASCKYLPEAFGGGIPGALLCCF